MLVFPGFYSQLRNQFLELTYVFKSVKLVITSRLIREGHGAMARAQSFANVTTLTAGAKFIRFFHLILTTFSTAF